MKENTNHTLCQLGYHDFFKAQALKYPMFFPARVITQNRTIYRVLGEEGESTAVISGKMQYEAVDAWDFPAVGDWVLIDRTETDAGTAVIHHILTRKSIFARKAPGKSQETQIVAANIDTVFICMALQEDYNLRRLERYLAIAWDSGARPVVVLTKADLCTDLSERIAEVEQIALGADVVTVSSQEDGGYAGLLPFIQFGETVALIGSSGVGKSTIINGLLGKEFLPTGGLRSDGKGRHTTTQRQLLLLPQGSNIIDNPGMRELHLDTADLEKTFSDIEALAAFCKYRDCTHQTEPGCAVQAALAAGEISAERLENYAKLQRETVYADLNSRQLEEEKIKRMFGSKGEMKQIRKDCKKRKKY